MRNSNLRKAAILIDSLDRTTADALLAQMEPDQMRRLGEELVSLGDIDPAEREAVIDEFFRLNPAAPQRRRAREAAEDDGVSLELSSALQDEMPEPRGPAFGFLHEADSRQLVPFLAEEHPQTIAVVVSHLPPARAAEVVAALASNVQVDVIRRVIALGETSPEIVREVEQGLQSRLARVASISSRLAAGTPAVSAMLRAADPHVQRSILSNLAAHDRRLATQVDQRQFVFADLMRLDDADLWTLIEAADPELLMLALAGATSDLLERVLAQFPAEESRRLRRALDCVGPLRLSDVEGAQDEIAQLARQLELEGRLGLPGGQRVGAAA